MTEETFIVPPQMNAERLDTVIAACVPALSRSAAQKLIASNGVFLNGASVNKAAKVQAGQNVRVLVPDPEPLEAVPQNIPVAIIYEDDDLLVVNKPKGMVVHPAAGNPDGTLVNALLYHCAGRLSTINGVVRPGIVHRIDKDTSGLLLVAKNDHSHQILAEQIQRHSLKREYRGVVLGHFREPAGTVSLPLGRSPTDRKKQAVNGINARDAVTHYTVIESYNGFDYAVFRLETGRTHQIRVHCAALGHPLAGDTVYGNPKSTYGLCGQCLHAAVLGFVHPRTGELMEFTAPLPEYFSEFLDRIR